MSVMARITVWSLPRSFAMRRFRLDSSELGKLRGSSACEHGLVRLPDAAVLADVGEVGAMTAGGVAVEPRDPDAAVAAGSEPQPVANRQITAMKAGDLCVTMGLTAIRARCFTASVT